MSKDPLMAEAFRKSDPYTYLAQKLGKDRSECKKALLVATNALDPDNPVLTTFGGFRTWILESIDKLHTNRYLESLLGRRFEYNEEDEQHAQDKRILNSVLQGTVVHAMQSSIWSIYRKLGNHFLTDRYDSIIMTCSDNAVDFIMNSVSEIMHKPFLHYTDLPETIRCATFPVAISVGSKWGHYEHAKDIR